jgi:hypothetical protein
MQAMARRRPLGNSEEIIDEEEHTDVDIPGPSGRALTTWKTRPTAGCQACDAALRPAGVRGDSRVGHGGDPRRAPPSVAARVRAVATVDAGTGGVLACLFGREERNLWPVGGGLCWPAPRLVAAASANAVWNNSRCCDCRGWLARLIATECIQAGSEITVASAHPIRGGDRDALGHEVSFDGAVRTVAGTRVAGAGAVLWSPIGANGREMLARTVVALPGVTDVVVAEAHGCAAALALLAHVQAGLRTARVVGDNPLLIRHGAAVGRLRNLQAESLMATAMAQATSNGWSLAWTLVGRDSNRASHHAASDGAAWARARSGLPGCGAPATRTEWRVR